MTELKTLQYPRHIHRDGQYQIVNSPEECDRAMDEGWVLSPGDPARPVKVDLDKQFAVPMDLTEHAGDGAESSPVVDDVPEPDAPVRRGPGRPSKTRH